MREDPASHHRDEEVFTIEEPRSGGTFAARNPAGKEVQLPFVLPGERVLAAAPEPIVLTPSPDRVAPRCPHFGACGGCQYQHAAYPAQLAFKRRLLLDRLAAAGVASPPEPQLHAADPWAYRNRIRLRVAPAADSPTGFHLGYNRRASQDLLPIHTCPIAAPSLLGAAQALTSLAVSLPAAHLWLTATAEMEIFTLPDESRLQLSLLLHTPPRLPAVELSRSFGDLCEQLQRVVPQLSGAGAALLRSTHANATQPRASRREAGRFAVQSWGSAGLAYPVFPPEHNRPFWVSRGSFFQVNRWLLPRLMALGTQDSAGGLSATAWDLFAGAGLFTRSLHRHFQWVTAVEGSASATADLASARLANVRIVNSPVLEFLRSAVLDRERPDFVLLDPPRAGLGAEAATLLTRIAPRHVTYVSCDPASLARDLAVMLSSGYNLAELHLVDMFPQTCHLETVASLHRP